MSASSLTSASDRLRAVSNRQGVKRFSYTMKPFSRSRSALPSSEPVSTTTTSSASSTVFAQRSINPRSFLQMA